MQGGQASSNLLQLPSGVKAQSVFSTASIRIGGRISQKLELQMSGNLSRSTANFVEHNVRSFIARARLDYWITDRMAVFATADKFFEDRNELTTTQFNRQRLFGGLEYRVHSPRKSNPQLAQK
jgi:hypothetical protein